MAEEPNADIKAMSFEQALDALERIVDDWRVLDQVAAPILDQKGRDFLVTLQVLGFERQGHPPSRSVVGSSSRVCQRKGR